MDKDEKEWGAGPKPLTDDDSSASFSDRTENNADSGWKFDAEAPTLNENLTIGNDYEINLTDDFQTDAETNMQAENGEDGKKSKLGKPFKIALVSILAAALVAVVAFFGVRFFTVPNSNERMTPGNVALKVGDTKVSVGMYNFYYSSIVSNYLNYASNGYYDIDTTISYADQTTTDSDGNEITWLELFKKSTVEQIQYVTAFYEKAVEAGITLTEEQQETIDSQIESLEQAAASSGKNGMSVDAYLQESYGDYCGVATLRKMLEQSYLAENYYYRAQIEFSGTEEEAKAYFESHKNDYYTLPYAYIEFEYDDEADNAETQALMQSYCDRIHSVDDMKALIPELCADLIDEYISYGYFEDRETAIEKISDSIETSQTASGITSTFNSDIADWAFSDDTAVGDTTYFIDDDYGYAYVFVKTGDKQFDETEVYSVRHILIMPETDEEGADISTATDAQWAAASEKANEILAEYQNGEKTELAFALLAEENSDDTASISAGKSGYYGGGLEAIELGRMVPEFENWATANGRQYGDVEIVKSEFGYHIMYFVFDGPTAVYAASYDLRTENENAFVDSCEIKECGGMKRVTVAEPTAS